MRIPFIGGAYEGRSKSINAQRSINMFPVVDNQDAKVVTAMYGTPGTDLFVDTGVYAKVRALHTISIYLIAVVGSTVFRITTVPEVYNLGDITTIDGHVGVASNGTQFLIVDGTCYGYIVTVDSGLEYIDSPNFPAAIDCAFFDGFFIVVEANSGRIHISKLYDGFTWDALDFATAESSPDNLVGIGTTKQNIWLFGEYTTEVYYNSGNPDFPFERVPGAVLDIGCAAIETIVEIDGNLYWLTNKGTVVRNNGYSYITMSVPDIEYKISTFSDLSGASAFTYSLEGRTFYAITFPTDGLVDCITYVCDTRTGYWHEWQSYI